jgi:adenylate kinase
MSKGQYVPDEVTVEMVRARLAEIPSSTRIIFDGFPRTVAQAQQLSGLLKERARTLGAVLVLDVPRAELLARLSKRAQVEGRPDDTPEVIAKRLDVYEEQTRPVIEYYENQGLLRRISGVGPIEDIARRLMAAA